MAIEPGHDWADCTLCDDGGCTGVIGGDGACRVCGRPSRFWGDERRRGQQDVADDEDDGDDAAPADLGPGAVDDDRRLCVDGGCVGLIGDDGTCKVCGLPGPERKSARRTGPGADTDTDTETDTATATATDSDSDDRRLCPDGSCIGVVDANGVCKECGRSILEN